MPGTAMGVQLESRQAFDRALAAHRVGDLAQAEAFYRALLAREPARFDAAHMLGVVLLQRGDAVQAERQLRRAAQLDPYSAAALNHLGLALRRQDRLEEAVRAYDRAVALDPGFADAHGNRANALRLLKRPQDALASYDRAVTLEPSFVDAHYNRGGVLEELQLFDDAAASYENAVALKPDWPEAFNNLGNALFSVARYDEALVAFNRALELKPDYADALTNRGNMLREIHCFDAAMADHTRAIALNPRTPDYFNNRAGVFRDTARFDEAIADYRHAIALAPGHIEARANLAITQLLLGDWENGLEGYDLRFRRRRGAEARRCPGVSVWTGEDLRGKHLLLFAEQGFGDALQFIRFVPLLQARGAAVTVIANRRLHRILATAAQGAVFAADIPHGTAFDYQLALMSVPRVLGIRPDTVPADTPYLHAEPRRWEIWRARLGTHGFRVGIAWQGNPAGHIDNGRSIPLRLFEPLGRIDRVRLVSLQKNFGVEQLDAAPPGMIVERPGFDFDEGGDAFIDTAAMMANLDLVITSDTSIAHLAGALGIPVLIALKHVPDWRWLMNRGDTPWYPAARLFRQPRTDDWTSVLQAMAAALAELAQGAATDGDVTTAA